MSYRVIALDLDGTLLTPNKTILPESLEALARAQQAGVQVLIVTGRHHCAIHPFYQALQLTRPPSAVTARTCTITRRNGCWLPIRWRKVRRRE